MKRTSVDALPHPVEHLHSFNMQDGTYVAMAGGSQLSIRKEDNNSNNTTTGTHRPTASYRRGNNHSVGKSIEEEEEKWDNGASAFHSILHSDPHPSYEVNTNNETATPPATNVQRVMEEYLLLESGGGAASSSSFSTPTITLCPRGSVITSLHVMPLVGLESALGVVGTDDGGVVLFLFTQRPTTTTQLTILREVHLSSFAAGSVVSGAVDALSMVTFSDAVISVTLAADPVGRPEFVAAATAHCVIVLDILLLLVPSSPSGAHPLEGLGAYSVLQSLAEFTIKGGNPSQEKGAPLFLRPSLPQVYRTLSRASTGPSLPGTASAPLVCVFPQSAGIIKLVAPTRFLSAFSLDCALLVCCRDGTIHSIQRHIAGGSAHLLKEHHHQRQCESHSMEDVYRLSSGGNSRQGGNPRDAYYYSSPNTLDLSFLSSLSYEQHALPHIEYQYSLAERAKIRLSWSIRGSVDSASIFVNDIAPFYDKVSKDMSLVVAGGVKTDTVASPSSFSLSHRHRSVNPHSNTSHRSHTPHAEPVVVVPSPTNKNSSSSNNNSTITHSYILPASPPPPASSSSSRGAPDPRIAATTMAMEPFWGVVEHAVLPLYSTEHTLKKEEQYRGVPSSIENPPSNRKRVEVVQSLNTVALPHPSSHTTKHIHSTEKSLYYTSGKNKAFASVNVLTEKNGIFFLFTCLNHLYKTSAPFYRRAATSDRQSSPRTGTSLLVPDGLPEKLPSLQHCYTSASLMEAIEVVPGQNASCSRVCYAAHHTVSTVPLSG